MDCAEDDDDRIRSSSAQLVYEILSIETLDGDSDDHDAADCNIQYLAQTFAKIDMSAVAAAPATTSASVPAVVSKAKKATKLLPVGDSSTSSVARTTNHIIHDTACVGVDSKRSFLAATVAVHDRQNLNSIVDRDRYADAANTTTNGDDDDQRCVNCGAIVRSSSMADSDRSEAKRSHTKREPATNNVDYNTNNSNNSEQRENFNQREEKCKRVDLAVNITLKRRQQVAVIVKEAATEISSSAQRAACATDKRCLSAIRSKMAAFFRNEQMGCNAARSKRVIFSLILIFSITAFVLLHNGSLRTRKTPNPSKFIISGNPFIAEFEFGQLKDLWLRISQNEVSFIMYYAPWDADCIRARNEFEIVSHHYGQQIFFGAINCWWPEGECRKYQNLRRYPYLVAHIRTEGEIEYKGPILASYIIPFLDNVMNPVVPIQNEGELLDLRAKHDAVLLGYFNFMVSPYQPGYRTYLNIAMRALISDPWRSVAYTVITNSRVATKLKIDPEKDFSLLLFVGNTTEHITGKSAKPAAILSWIYSRARTASTLKWLSPSGVKSTKLADYIQKSPTLILFSPRSFILGISPYFDLLREIVLDYYNCDNSPIIRSLIHRNILRRRLLEDKLSELEERCHELLDEDEINDGHAEDDRPITRRFNNNEDTCCHTQTVKWRSYGGARRGMTKKCLCTSCVHISLPKCPAKCNHFDCLSTASRFLDDFDPNSVNNSAVYCNQIRSMYEPKYTSYYKIATTCSGTLSPPLGEDVSDGAAWNDVDKFSALSSDDKISRMIQDFEIQHCRRLKLGMNYTDLNFPDSSESRQSAGWRINFSGLACRTNRTLRFLALDSALYPAFAESLGIDVFNVPHSTVALIIDPVNENVHVLNHEILYKNIEVPNFDTKSVMSVPVNSYSKRSFMKFIKDFTEGSLPRFLRSQIVSSSGLCDLKQMIVSEEASPGNKNVICVPELNTVTFTNFVLGKSFDGKDNRSLQLIGPKLIDKDILVMYYAPWCGFCTSIAHIYLDVARFFALSNDIIFTRINGDANDLPWEYTVDRYPTIMLFPANRRENSLVYPPNKAITKLDLLQFILEHGQLSVRIHTMLTFCERSCIERTLKSNHSNRRSLARAIRHNSFARTLNQFEIEKIERKERKSFSSKDVTRSKNRKNQLLKYDHFLLSNLRRLRRAQRKQSYLEYFLMRRIDYFLKNGINSETMPDTNIDRLGKKLYSIFSDKAVFGARKQKAVSIVNAQRLKQKSMEIRRHRDEL